MLINSGKINYMIFSRLAHFKLRCYREWEVLIISYKIMYLTNNCLYFYGLKWILHEQLDILLFRSNSRIDNELSKIKIYNPDLIFIDISSISKYKIVLDKIANNYNKVLIVQEGNRYYEDFKLNRDIIGILENSITAEYLIESLTFIRQGYHVFYTSVLNNVYNTKKELLIGQKEISSNELTNREIDILNFAALGFQNKKIGKKLNISIHTVKKHFSNIFFKLDSINRTEAIYKAKEYGILKKNL